MFAGTVAAAARMYGSTRTVAGSRRPRCHRYGRTWALTLLRGGRSAPPTTLLSRRGDPSVLPWTRPTMTGRHALQRQC